MRVRQTRTSASFTEVEESTFQESRKNAEQAPGKVGFVRKFNLPCISQSSEKKTQQIEIAPKVSREVHVLSGDKAI